MLPTIPLNSLTLTLSPSTSAADKSSSENKIDILLQVKDGYLFFQTKNGVHEEAGTTEHTGFGIKNLRKRLSFLYGEKYELNIDKSGHFFIANLKVPLS